MQLTMHPTQGRLEYLVGLRIPGQPVPARREVRQGRGQRHASAAWSTRYRAWKADAVRYLRRWTRTPQGLALLEDGPLTSIGLVVRCTAIVERPQRVPRYTVDGRTVAYPYPWTPDRRPHLGTMDCNNLSKGPPDAMVRAGILQDDRWLFVEQPSKWYAAEGERAGTEVRLWRYLET